MTWKYLIWNEIVTLKPSRFPAYPFTIIILVIIFTLGTSVLSVLYCRIFKWTDNHGICFSSPRVVVILAMKIVSFSSHYINWRWWCLSPIIDRPVCPPGWNVVKPLFLLWKNNFFLRFLTDISRFLLCVVSDGLEPFINDVWLQCKLIAFPPS